MHINLGHIPIPFLTYSADILADTDTGLSGNEIVKQMSAYSVEYQVNIPFAQYPFDVNKRTVMV